MEQYPPGTTKVYSYLCARKGFGDANLSKMTFFGLQYYIKHYLLKGVRIEHVEEFIKLYSGMAPMSDFVKKQLFALSELNYLPIEIKAVEEMQEYPLQIPLLTITNTEPEFYWLVNYVEGLLLKLWYPCSVATRSKQYYDLAKTYSDATCDIDDHLDYCVHDFGYRSTTSDESAAIGGAAHLINFSGSDTILGEHMLQKYYGRSRAKSVPASEHSVMCSNGREGELKSFERMLDLYPTGVVSIVSDTYDLWNVLENFTDILKERILARDGKVVFRPDSGNPPDIIDRAMQILWDKFGGTINSKGYKVLNPKVGLIYGDGIYLERYEEILNRLKNAGFASSNLVIGVGGILLQNLSRDDMGFAQKTTYIEVDGQARNVFKDPITDPKKRSHRGLLALNIHPGTGSYMVDEECSWQQEEHSLLKTVFRDGLAYSPKYDSKVLMSTN
jgi:nicotinamide phosphoribosyltransferase